MDISTMLTSKRVLFDQFHNNDDRMPYELVIISVKGTGKSNLLKIILLHNGIKDNFTRRMQNIIEIVKTDENKKVSFSKHFNKVRTIYSTISDVLETK